MKTLFAAMIGLVIVCSAEKAQAQFGYYGPPAVVAAPPFVVAPPAPVVAYYGGPAVAFAPAPFVAAPLVPGPLYYSVRQRTYWRGPYYRSTVRIRGW
jgi:hypothetical protein